MKFFKILCAIFAITGTQLAAQDEYFWATNSGVTGETAVAWADNFNQDVRVSIYDFGTWSKYETIPGSQDSYPWPILIKMDPSSNVVVVWGNSNDGTILSSIKLAGENWTEAKIISPEFDYSLEPVITMDPAGNMTIVYLNFFEGLQVSRLSAGTSTWSKPVTISQ